MENYDVYKDIAMRTDGDIYVGAVGPVRTGKSTFVRRFAEIFLMPNIAVKNKKKIAVDELPQSGDGKTVTTTEPKFIPAEGVKITLKDKSYAKMRLIDCVGFIVDGAIGAEEDGAPRLVKTPWNDSPVPFKEAAETGTEKVIKEHSTVGVVITTDGSFTDIKRESYEVAEERTVEKLREIGKPFTIVLNSSAPNSEACVALADKLSAKYNSPVVRMNVLTDGEDKFAEVMKSVLTQFPLKAVDIDLPEWLKALPYENEMIQNIVAAIGGAASGAAKMSDANIFEDAVLSIDKMIPSAPEFFAGEGRIKINVTAENGLFYEVVSKVSGEEIKGEYALMNYVAKLAEAKAQKERIGSALKDAEENGYGVVVPTAADIEIGEPELVRQGARYGVRIAATSESYHIVKVGVRATVDPVSGTKKQCEEFLGYLKDKIDEVGVKEADVFGRPLGQLIEGELAVKGGAMPDDAKKRVRRSVAKMVNEGKYRVFYIVY
ncbi:MAG: stage IV sporulation protein A [Clostridia bacterium]|nr:stage IV sporulation protein A [Clostridia bacterium]